MTSRILIVDDDAAVTASLSLALSQEGFECEVADSPESAYTILEKDSIDLIFQDMNFSRKTTGEEGLEMLAKVRLQFPALPIVLITAWGSIELAVKGMQAGASDFVTKPWSNDQIVHTAKAVLGVTKAHAERDLSEPPVRSKLDNEYDFSGLIGDDPSFLRILDIIGRISATDASVIITGESGTGKELIAEAIHNNSARYDKPFIKVNLGGISSSLFESEMFGHVKGAFTDAKADREGRFALADGGTIFLDEIGDLELDSQVKLLRVLQDRTYEVLGSSKARTVDVRILSATNRNISEMVENREFREDLLYRLNLIALHIPALRDRSGDIAHLVNYFLSNLGKIYRRPEIKIENDALNWLRTLSWPGNIRELKQLIERTVLLSTSDVITLPSLKKSLEMRQDDPTKAKIPEIGDYTLDEVERIMVEKAFQQCAGNISEVARLLGLSRAATYRRLEKYGINL